MDYSKHYYQLIARSQQQTITGYSEVHHILPRCIGGTDEPHNKTRLTAEEHFMAHKLLMFMYPEHLGLMTAVKFMTKSNKSPGRINNKLYGWYKKHLIARLTGTSRSEETKIKISEKLKGHTFTDETREKIRNTLKGRIIPDETRKRMGLSRKGKKRGPFGPMSDEQKEIRRIASTGRKMSPEILANMRRAQSNRKPISDETRSKMSEAAKRRPPKSAETRAKHSAAMLIRHSNKQHT